nr:glycosyltransferase family 2 protein [uncultured Carboxylicivirga sp.]
MLPKVTVVTVNYNNSIGLEKTICSTISQTYSSIEYIIIDGASQDNSIDIIKKYEGQVNLWVSEEDSGVYDAMNKAIDLISGDWVVFMNSGDTFYNDEVIESLFHKNLDHNIAVVYGDVCLCFKYGEVIRKIGYSTGSNMPPLCHQATFLKAEKLKKRKFNLKYKLASDYDVNHSLYLAGEVFSYFECVIANYDMTGISAQRLDLYYNEVAEIKGNYSTLLMSIAVLKTWIRRFMPGFFDYLLFKVLKKRERKESSR